ncbi:pilus assembly protein PilP [Pistricoccus aurantiacus]|uniref:pilus assembly protein PilP n=1 Tax=Pistricoccus aurantiacus TaxID=1883414 RepID=UPI00363E43D7
MIRRLSVLLAALTLAGCTETDFSSLERKLVELRAVPGSFELEPLPEVPTYVATSYEQGDRRSPFKAPMPESEPVAQDTSDLKPDLSRPKEPLEAFKLESLDLVGTLMVSGQTFALVRAPDGEVHRLRQGDYLGTDFGRVIDITDTAVQLMEVVTNGGNGWVERTRRLTFEEQSTKRAG